MNDNSCITIIAIDPGLSGGIAVHIDGQPVSAHRMPATEGDLLDLLRLGTAPACASRTEWKNKLKACAQRLCAQRLYPHVQCTLATADALLILYYAMSVGLITVPTIQTAGRGRLAPTA